ncbi:MAG: hypothetical protein LUD14_11880, partial [Clostridiales bacterium]|nr:hypothetical protein [Clostridiales bacterium]
STYHRRSDIFTEINSHTQYKWSDAKELIAYADEAYEDRVLKEGADVLKLPLTNAVSVTKGHITYPEEISAATSDEQVAAFLSDADTVDILYDLPECIEAPAEAGTGIGTEKIYLNGVLYEERAITLSESAEAYDFCWCITWAVSVFLL